MLVKHFIICSICLHIIDIWWEKEGVGDWCKCEQWTLSFISVKTWCLASFHHFAWIVYSFIDIGCVSWCGPKEEQDKKGY